MYGLCFALVLVMPLIMFAMGLRWKLRPPAFKTGKLVYRTELTERSPACWEFAHVYIAKLWTRYGVILAAACGAAMVLLKENYQTYLLWLLGGQTLVLCVTIFLMDMFLKNLFDEDGKRIEGK